MIIKSGHEQVKPIERIANILNINKDKSNNENELCLLIQDKLVEMKKKNNKDNLEKFKFKTMYEQTLKNNKKEVIHKSADVKEYEKEIARLKSINMELQLSIEGLRREVKMYKNDRINNILCTNISKDDSKFLL